jgi:RND family efflux transporter MFP subunit
MQNLKKLFLLIFVAALVFRCISCERNNAQQNPDATTTIDVQNTTIKGIPVEAMILQEKEVQQDVPLTAVLQPLHTVDIIAEVSGKINKINKELGDAVSPEDVLAVIDDKIPLSNYRQSKSQVLSAENNLKIAQLNLKSDEQLLKTGDISELQFEQSQLAVKTAEANHLSALANLSTMEKIYQDTRIRSPIKGLISRKYIDIGMMVNPNMALYRVVNLTTLKMEVGIPQSLITAVQIGSKAQVRLSGFSNETFDGYVRYISPQADEQSGAFTVELHVKNTPSQKIRAGMTAKVDITLIKFGAQLVIPKYALVTKNGSEYVYKIRQGKARLIDVTTGETFGSQIIINDGLMQGDTIVIVGMKNLGMETDIWIETLH